MAVDMFMKIDNVKGEAQDKAYKDKIDVLAWSWGRPTRDPRTWAAVPEPAG